MAYEFQVAVDCADAHTLADWWAETLGWQVAWQPDTKVVFVTTRPGGRSERPADPHR